MSSILKVDTIQDQSGNNIISEAANVITIGASGDTITVPAGATVSGFTSAGIDDNATSTAITISSDEDVTFTEDILLGDNKKAIFGAGSDLQIFHDGSNSYISDTATGDLRIRGSSAIKLEDNNGSETFAIFNDDGAVDLYHNNVKKFETTSAGATITGTAKVSSASSGVTPNANADELFVEGSGNSGITIGSGTSGAGQLCFGDSGDNDTGALAYLHDVNAMRFTTGGTERARIDGSGDVLIGKTSISTNAVGVALMGTGLGAFTRSGSMPIIANRTTDDGTIQEFRKDNTTVGSIGTFSSKIHIGSGNANFRFRDDLTAIIPANSDGSNSDNDLDLGYSTVRWRRLYLSEGVFLGGTGTSNKLDDYEEGTWTASLSGTTGAPSGVNYSSRTGRYTKIGRLVEASVYLALSSWTSAPSGNALVSGLPFTVDNVTNVYFSAIVGWCSNFDSDNAPKGGWGEANSSTIRLIKANSTSARDNFSNNVSASALNGNEQLIITIVYETA